MSLLIGFDPSQVPDAPGYAEDVIVPEGKYRVVLDNVKEDESRAGTFYVRWHWVIVDGPMKGTEFDTVHFPKSSEGSMGVFMGHTKSLCRALGLGGVSDYTDLYDKVVVASVIVNKYKDRHGDDQVTNRIKFFDADGGAKPAAVQQVAGTNLHKPVSVKGPNVQQPVAPVPEYEEPPPF